MKTEFIGDFIFSIPNNNLETEENAKKQAKDLMEKHYAFYGQLQDNQHYVTRGSILCCTAGVLFTKFDIPCDHGVTLEDGSPVGTCSDCKAANNIYNFGVCHLSAPDGLPERRTISINIPEAPATNRAIPVTGQKCIPIFCGNWTWKEEASVKIWNKDKQVYDNVLKADCALPCLYGGFITVVETPDFQSKKCHYISNPSLNYWQVPLYDDLTIDTNALGCTCFEVDFDNNSITKGLKNTYGFANDTRVKVGSTYGKVNYGTDAKMGPILPYTEVDGRMSIAIPWRYTYEGADNLSISKPDGKKWNVDSIAGRYVDIVFTDGTVLACILGDAKGIEANNYNGFAHTDKSIIEVLGYSDLPLKQYNKSDAVAYHYEGVIGIQVKFPMIDVNGLKLCKWSKIFDNIKPIQKIVVYSIQYYTQKQKEKAWFTESMS